MDVKQVKSVAVVGAGIMGIGIAQNFAQAGLSVKLLDMDQKILNGSLAQIGANLSLFQEYGLLREDPSNIISRISTFPIGSAKLAIPGCQYIVEAIPEILEAKKSILTEIEKYSPKAIIASNTSSFTINELVLEMKNPDRVLGVHYFNPAHIIPTVEIHRGDKTAEGTVELTRKLMSAVGKKPVLVRKILPGFIVNRLTAALEREIDYLLDEGVVAPEDLDTAVKGSIGFRMACLGPQEAEDMIGLDTSMRVSQKLFKELSNAIEPSPQLVAKVKKGELGIKSGRGWYNYSSRSGTEVLDDNNRKLLEQLAVFNARESTKK